MKKILNIKFILIFLFAIIILNFNSIYALSSYTIDNYDINATILKNGDMHIIEKLEYSFKENLDVINKDIIFLHEPLDEEIEKISNMHMPTGIDNVRVYVSQNDISYVELKKLDDEGSLRDNAYAMNFKDNSFNLDIYSSSKINSKKYIKYEYDLKDIAVKYNNKGAVYWNFIGGNLKTNVDKVSITVNFEEDTKLLEIYPHSYCKISDVNYYNNFANFEIYNLGLQSAVDARIVFDNSSIADAKKVVAEDYDINNMNDIENSINNKKFKYKMSNFLYILFDVYMGISYVVLIIIILRKTNKGKIKNVDYRYDILSDLLFIEYNLLNGDSCLKTNFFVATLLELIDKKYIDVEFLKDEEGKKGTKENYEYYLSVKSNTDLSKLNSYQKLVINYLFNKEVNSSSIDTLIERKIFLKERLKQLSKDYKLVKAFATECGKIDYSIKKKLYKKSNTKGINLYVLISVFIVFILMLVNTFIISPLSVTNNLTAVIISASFLIGYVILLLPFTQIDIIKKEYIDEYNNMQGLKKYILNYSIVKEKHNVSFEDESTLIDYLIFSCIFGLPQPFSKEIILSNRGSDDIYIKYPYLHMCTNFPTLSSLISTSTGSNSGGGYSGDEELDRVTKN